MTPTCDEGEVVVKSFTSSKNVNKFEKIILDLESNFSMSKNKQQSYLLAVDGILGLRDNDKLAKRVDNVIQMAMLRLEEEFRGVMISNVLPFDEERICGSIRRISLSMVSNDDFETSVDDDRESLCEETRVSLGEDLCLDLVNADAVVDLKEIAERMTKAGYEKECCQVYSSVRRDALYDCLMVLGFEKMSIEEVQRLEWGLLDDKMKKWIHAVKVVVRFVLSAEKQLCQQIFGVCERIRGECFTETAKACLMQLLNFGQAIVVVQWSPEKLFRILDMYDALANVQLELKVLFSDGSGDSVCAEAESLLTGLGEAAKHTFEEFENAVQSESSHKPTQGGEIHPLTRYVMNYIKLLVDYSDSLNLLLENDRNRLHNREGDDAVTLHLDNISPMGRRLQLLISSLESSLEHKSELYEDRAMRYIFLMNNILYIVQKVKNSELGKLLGDQWVRKRRSQIRQYSTCYLRASWSKVLSYLKDEGIAGSGSFSNISKVILKERFKNFNATFEEIYKVQSTWKVPDPQLRDELRISISERVIPAYRSFMGRFRSHLESGRHAGKYIKYTAEDIENHLSDLFEGSPGILQNIRRKLNT